MPTEFQCVHCLCRSLGDARYQCCLCGDHVEVIPVQSPAVVRSLSSERRIRRAFRNYPNAAVDKGQKR